MSFPLAGWQRLLLRHRGVVYGIVLLLLAAAAVVHLRFQRNEWGPLLILAIALLLGHRGWARRQRKRVIGEAPMPESLRRKLEQSYPHLGPREAERVEGGLRQFFLACLLSGRRFVAMPSRVVDTMWRDFILDAQAYREWCELALGRVLPHTPAEALGADAQRNDGLRRAWYWACAQEAISPRRPKRLPLLFALDGELEIPGGFRYVPDFREVRLGAAAAGVLSAASFGDGSASGDSAGFGGLEAAPGATDAAGSSGAGAGGGDGGGGD